MTHLPLRSPARNTQTLFDRITKHKSIPPSIFSERIAGTSGPSIYPNSQSRSKANSSNTITPANRTRSSDTDVTLAQNRCDSTSSFVATTNNHRLSSSHPRNSATVSLLSAIMRDHLSKLFGAEPIAQLEAKFQSVASGCYHRRMKSNPKTGDEYTNFQNALRQVLSVSKQELNRRIAADNASRAGKPKRGPKPHSSASGHASGDKG